MSRHLPGFWLLPPLLAQWLTRGRGGRAGLAGFCVGWAAGVLVRNSDGSFLLPDGNAFWVIVGVCLLRPVLGYAVGRGVLPKR